MGKVMKTMEVIGNCTPFDELTIPILHHVATYAFQLFKNDFMIRYVSAAYLQDKDGHNLDQAILTSGKKTFQNHGSYFLLLLRDDQVREIIPTTDLFPFMAAASGENSDLSAVYVLLKKNPSLVGSNFARGHKIDDGDRLRNHLNTRSKTHSAAKRSKQQTQIV